MLSLKTKELKITEENLKDAVNEHIKKDGIKAKFICEKINFSESVFCKWRKGLYNYSINPTSRKLLIDYLTDKGYLKGN